MVGAGVCAFRDRVILRVVPQVEAAGQRNHRSRLKYSVAVVGVQGVVVLVGIQAGGHLAA